jgi:hypothetical protein
MRFDSNEADVYESHNRRREREVRGVLEKIRPELITMDTEFLARTSLSLRLLCDSYTSASLLSNCASPDPGTSRLDIPLPWPTARVTVYNKDLTTFGNRAPEPYLTLPLPGLTASSAMFCPYDDVLAVGHGKGISSLLVPGSGEAQFQTS